VIEAFALSFGVILLAELGDKSQLMTIAFAARHPWWVVLAGISAATLLISAISVALGSAVALVLPAGVLPIVAGIAFLVFAAWTLRGDGDEDGAEERLPASAAGRSSGSARPSSWPSSATRRCWRRSRSRRRRSRSGRGSARRPG
jgi:Ca2+/H+ antiporter, TMEM165/GDT1 family